VVLPLTLLLQAAPPSPLLCHLFNVDYLYDALLLDILHASNRYGGGGVGSDGELVKPLVLLYSHSLLFFCPYSSV